MLLKLERDRTAAALNKRFGPSIPVHKLIQALQMELGISQGNGILPASPSKSPNSTIKAVTAKSGDTVGEQSVRTVSTPFKPKMSQQQRKHLEAIRTVKRQEVSSRVQGLAQADAARCSCRQASPGAGGGVPRDKRVWCCMAAITGDSLTSDEHSQMHCVLALLKMLKGCNG